MECLLQQQLDVSYLWSDYIVLKLHWISSAGLIRYHKTAIPTTIDLRLEMQWDRIRLFIITINIIIVVVSVHGQVKSRVECWEDEAICCEMEIGFPFIIDTVLSRFCIACLWVGGRSFVLGIASSSKVLLFRCLCMFLMFADPRNEWACYMPIAHFSGSDFPNNYHRSKNGNCNLFRVQCNSCFAPNDSTLESNHKLTTNNSISGGFI